MSLYLKYLSMHLKSELQYKMSFILSFISQFFTFFGYYFTILCLFNKFSNIKGFTVYEVLLTFSIVTFGCSFCEVFFRGMDQFDKLIVEGNFDRLLLRPRNIILQVFGEEINYVKLSRVLQSLVILVIALLNLNVEWNIYKVLTLLLMMLGSITLFLSLFTIAATYCFITVKGLEIRHVLTDGGKHLAQYPIGIFRKGFVLVLTYIVPFGFVNYYPLLYILGRVEKKVYIFSPITTILYLIVSLLLFYKGVKKYSSVGS
ncbi:MAG: ABC-2 family transporter protein [Bacilli bacterium]|nr:ABC-2 family transporter protein [Bacilli bacterium]